MRVGDRVIAIDNYKQIGLKKGMTGTVEKVYNDGNEVIHWNELDRSTYHHSHHHGLVFIRLKEESRNVQLC